jgi:exosome complex component RRP42
MLTARYFIPNLHLTLLSSSGSPLTALVLAARAAFMDLRIPSTKRIGWEESETISYDGMKDSDLSGIKSAVKAGRIGGKGKGKAAVKGDEWDLDLTTAGGRGVEWMVGRENLPVLVTLHLVRHCHFSLFMLTRLGAQESSDIPRRSQPRRISLSRSSTLFLHWRRQIMRNANGGRRGY